MVCKSHLDLDVSDRRPFNQQQQLNCGSFHNAKDTFHLFVLTTTTIFLFVLYSWQ